MAPILAKNAYKTSMEEIRAQLDTVPPCIYETEAEYSLARLALYGPDSATKGEAVAPDVLESYERYKAKQRAIKTAEKRYYNQRRKSKTFGFFDINASDEMTISSYSDQSNHKILSKQCQLICSEYFG